MTQIEDIGHLIDECLHAPIESLDPLFERAFKEARERFSDTIAFHMPGMVHYETDFYEATDPYRFPSFSVTGSGCALNCEHCKGHLLESMIPTLAPEILWEKLREVKRRGGKGALVSGGATSKGNTPLMEFVPVMAKAKKELDLNIVVHTGVVFPEMARALADAEIDGAMLDVIGSAETLREVYHLNLKPTSFDQSMALLEENGVPVMPHIVVGLHFGKLVGEAEAIKMIAKHDPKSIIVVALKPLDGTPMEQVTPSSPTDIARVILATRLAIPDKPLILGCARPHGAHRRETDRLAIDAGVSGIAYPTEEGYEHAKERGLSIVMSEECCSLMDNALPLLSQGGR
ncbi:MAG: radical SAM protein [Candidatus Thorarchaeota archaeon]|nr:MAG: radical SAM protein [Candidatus Thorarchaeota archaeon]